MGAAPRVSVDCEPVSATAEKQRNDAMKSADLARVRSGIPPRLPDSPPSGKHIAHALPENLTDLAIRTAPCHPSPVKLHVASFPLIFLTTTMGLFQARAGTQPTEPLPEADGRANQVKGTPLDRLLADKKFETATFGIG